ncbi:hypothetical protein HZU75_05790 [Chitinibacter fontanus]|uniref:DUF6268 domain-containing protein n=1 Tax=Chitinibacter fontanus TaxID=1737446 RepID=A0A7D5V913_9NEIS|nr:DUF6268 family outer membrane beta-barrel protein [Chitinibacter fontanus]QLI81079.1 hypothetical protein HZU75_05790 [Chitinibacter fontanus]
MLKTLICGTLLAATSLAAQAGDTKISYAITPVMVPEFNLDSGGSADATWMMASIGVNQQLDAQSSIGIDLAASRQDWTFHDVKAWGNVEQPWGVLHRWTVAVPYTFASSSGWLYSVAPGVELSSESGAANRDSVSYGATAFAAKMISPSLMLGLGVSAWTGLEDASVFPFLVVNWQITDSLRLANPFKAGPAGPAGLELSWKATPALELGAGGTFRSFTSRLSGQNQVAANGLLEDNSMPVFMRASYSISKELRFDAYAGAAMGGEFEIRNAQNQVVRTEKHDAMPFLALTASGSF